nr:RedB [Rhodopirellula sp. JC740]
MLSVLFMLPVLLGMSMLANYANQPGPEAIDVPVKLTSGILPEWKAFSARPTVVFFYHPHCPCTRATVRTWERLIATSSTQPKIFAYAYRPADVNDQWVESDLTDAIRKLGDVDVIADAGGDACRRFGVTTSGHLLVYGVNGELKFSGGITSARGHEGESQAGSAFIKQINLQSTAQTHWPVFGCAVVSEAEGV